MGEVAQAFADALVAAYRSSVRTDRLSRQADLELTRRFVDSVISYLETGGAQPRGDEEPAELPAEESIESVGDFGSMESVHAYTDFLNSVVSFSLERDRRTRILSGD
jgi:hypothetical protein